MQANIWVSSSIADVVSGFDTTPDSTGLRNQVMDGKVKTPLLVGNGSIEQSGGYLFGNACGGEEDEKWQDSLSACESKLSKDEVSDSSSSDSESKAECSIVLSQLSKSKGGALRLSSNLSSFLDLLR